MPFKHPDRVLHCCRQQEDECGVERVITKIERQRRNPARFNIYVDGEYAFSVHEDVLIRCRLSKGKVLEGADVADVLQEEERQSAVHAALKFVRYKPRTRAEVERHLKDKGFETEFIRAALTRLQNYGYVNDEAFARAWVEERRRLRGKGRYALKRELQQKGIEDRIITEVLAPIDDEDEYRLAREWAYKKYERLKHLEWRRAERRIGSFLQRKGFSLSHITAVLNELRAEGNGAPCDGDGQDS